MDEQQNKQKTDEEIWDELLENPQNKKVIDYLLSIANIDIANGHIFNDDDLENKD